MLLALLSSFQLLEIDVLQIGHRLLPEISNLALVEELGVLQQLILGNELLRVCVLQRGHSLLAHGLKASRGLNLGAKVLVGVVRIVRLDDGF